MPSTCGSVKGEEPPETSEALILVLHEEAQGQALWNTMVTQKNVIKNYGHGQYVGRAEQMHHVEGEWKRSRTVAVLKFDTMDEAVRWFHCDRLCKQQDWLGTSELYAVPLTTPFPPGDHVMSIMTLCIKDKDKFYGEFKKKHQESVRQHGGITRVAGTESVKKLRGSRPIPFLSIDLFPSTDHFDKWLASRENDCVAQSQKDIAPGPILAFSLQYCH